MEDFLSKFDFIDMLRRKGFVLFSTSVLLPLFIGVLIYYYCRCTKYIRIFNALGITSEDISFTIPSFISYSVPDLLWVFAFTNSMIIIWKNNNDLLPRLFKISFPIMALLSEFLQYIEVINGTFDIYDLLAYAMGISMSYILHTIIY